MNAQSQGLVVRGGELAAPDEAFFASFTADVPRMLEALNVPTNPIERHFLLLALVNETYKQRNQEEMRKLCADVCEMHLTEFSNLAEHLEKQFGILPRVPTFQHYSTLLTETGDYEKAVSVCQAAIDHGLHDGTKSGYEGRIARIRRAQAQRAR